MTFWQTLTRKFCFIFPSPPKSNTISDTNPNTNMNIPHNMSSAQTIASIDDLLTEILLRLPLKPLGRFKSVSKHWNSIISDPGFAILRNPDPNPAVGLIFGACNTSNDSSKRPYAQVLSFDKSINPQIRTLDNFPTPSPCTVLNSCNGLLLISTINGTSNRLHPVQYYISNPTTGKYFGLPQTDEKVVWIDHCNTCLAFDPNKSPHYKVVCARELGNRTRDIQYQLEVYSSETGCWRKFGGPVSGHVNFGRGVYWNGAIHWISYNLSRNSLYVKLDDDDETPREMPTPPHTGSTPYYFEESCGHLHYIQGYMGVREFNVHEMSADYSEWFVKYKIVDFDFKRSDFLISALVRGKKDDDSFLVFRLTGAFVKFNLVDQTYEIICELQDERFKQCIQYIESLCYV